MWRNERRFPAIQVGALVGAALLLSGCGGFGRVEQGRVVAWDAREGVVTLILDSNFRDPERPKYDVLPPVTVRVPKDASQMGPAPVSGRLVELDVAASRAVVYDAAGHSLKTVSFTLIEKVDNVPPEDTRVTRGRLPAIEHGKNIIRLYWDKGQQIVTIFVAGGAVSADDWRTGDEVRYYFKHPGQALRMMNVTRTKLL